MSVDSSFQISSEDGSTQVFPPGVMIICCYVSLIFLHTDNRTVIVAGSMSQMKFGMKLMQTKIQNGYVRQRNPYNLGYKELELSKYSSSNIKATK